MKSAGIIPAGAARRGALAFVWLALAGAIGFARTVRDACRAGMPKDRAHPALGPALPPLQRPVIVDLTPGGRLEERERGAAARKPN